MCFEGFLFGNVSVLCALTCNLAISFAQKVQLFTVLGVYSGIFAIYLQWTSDESRTLTANVVFYAICLLYVFCAATVVGDFISYIVQVSNKFSICKSIIFIISFPVSRQYTIASTSNRITANITSHLACPKHSKWLFWLYLPMHLSTRKSFKSYLSSVWFTQIFKDLSLLDRMG